MAINPTKSSTLLDKNVNIEPSGVIYNIRGSHVADFTEGYLAKQNIDGIERVVVRANREGNNRPEVAVYLFIDSRSNYINSSAKNVPANLRNKLDNINIELSEDLKKVLHPLCGKEIKCGKTDRNMTYVKLDIFRILALMFDVTPSQHNIIIPDVVRIPQENDIIFSLIKEIRYHKNKGENSKDDYFNNLAANIERR